MGAQPWHTLRCLAFDLETTGLNLDQDRVVSAAAHRVSGGQPPATRDWLLNPGVPIPAAASRVHGITDDIAQARGMDAAKGIEEIATVIAEALEEGLPLVGHNLGLYDLNLFDAEMRRHLGGSLTEFVGRPVGPVIDTRTLDQHVIPRRRRTSQEHGPRTLRITAGVYRLAWDEEQAHGSSYDALQAARVAWHIGNIAHLPTEKRPRWVYADHRFDDVAGLSLEELHGRQVGWAREQAAGLSAALGKPVDGSWPLREVAS